MPSPRVRRRRVDLGLRLTFWPGTIIVRSVGGCWRPAGGMQRNHLRQRIRRRALAFRQHARDLPG